MRVADVEERLKALGHDVVSVRRKGLVYEVEVRGDQAAADADLPGVLSSGRTDSERLRDAAEALGMRPVTAALAVSLDALLAGRPAPRWASSAVSEAAQSILRERG